MGHGAWTVVTQETLSMWSTSMSCGAHGVHEGVGGGGESLMRAGAWAGCEGCC